jgi:excisionase family DNA binding protein
LLVTVKFTELPPLDPIQRYTVPEAAAYLRICVALVNRRIKDGSIASIKDGKRRYIPGAEIARLSALPAQVA